MLHQFDSNAIAHQQHLNQQFFQQQQQQQQQPQQQQQQQQNPIGASKHVVAPGHEPGFSHDSHGHGHDHGQATDNPDQDFSHTAPSPLMLQPTILPSQPLPPSSPLHRALEPHSHMMHHQRSVFELQHAYQQHHQALLQHQQQQQQQAMDQHEQHTGASERGRKGTAETGYHRKRSLSVPLLLSLNPSQDPKSQQGTNGDQRRPVAVSSDSQPRQLLPHTGGGEGGGGQDHDGDQDMDTDDGHHAHPQQQQDPKASKASSLTIDYSEMILPRETLLATVPRTYSHRVYAGHGVYHHSSTNHGHHDHGSSTNSGTLYYNHGHISSHPHHHFSLRSRHHHHHHHHLHYNPFLNRKFPPYKYWAISAQRDYHLSRIGILVGRPGTSSSSASGVSAASSSSPSSSGSSVATATSSGGGPPPGAGGDLMLRTALGSAGGGVTKTHYRSRLPVHLRHMTSRTNRRPAICGNPFQDDARAQQGSSSVGRSNDDPGFVSHENSQSLLSSSSTSGSTAAATSAATTASGGGGGGGSEAGQRRRLSDWKRVTALNLDLEDDPRGGMIMRLASQDRVTPVGNSSRHWMNQRGGLANLMQGSSARVGSSSAAGSTGRDTTGTGGGTTSTVDRLVEEMNKWSV